MLNYESEYIHLIEYLRKMQKKEEEILDLQKHVEKRELNQKINKELDKDLNADLSGFA